MLLSHPDYSCHWTWSGKIPVSQQSSTKLMQQFKGDDQSHIKQRINSDDQSYIKQRINSYDQSYFKQ